MPRDYYLQPKSEDPVWTDEEVLFHVRRHTPEARAVKGVDESGGEARTYFIDDKLLLKVQRPHRVRPRTSLEREAFFLKRLEGYTDISVPHLVGYGRTESGGEYSLISQMPGKTVNRCTSNLLHSQTILRDLGFMLRCIHDIPQEPLVNNPLFPGDRSPVDALWRFGNLFDETVAAILNRPGSWSFRLSPEEIANKAMALLPLLDKSVALHSNPGEEHVFIDESKGSLIGIIDFGDSYIGHPVLDLIRWLKPEDRSMLYEGYTRKMPVDDSWNRTWSVACVLADLRVVLQFPDSVEQAYAEINAILG